jgi:diguanylate cyclase (GGDEF)-like protein/PAS domain S-box-containing protein
MTKKTIPNLLQLALDSLPIRVFLKDRESQYLGANKSFLADAGLESLDKLIGQSDRDMPWTEVQTESFYADDQEVMSSGKPKINIEEPQLRPDDSVAWLRTNKIPLYDGDKTCIGLIGTYEDITERVNQRKATEKIAMLDELTQLPNKRAFFNELEQQDQLSGALIYIDLDHFKVVNESMGTEVGDQLICAIGQRIQRFTSRQGAHSPQCTMARIGGDRFAIYLYRESSKNLKLQIERSATELLSALSEPYQLVHHLVNQGASLGIALIDERQSTDIDKKALVEYDSEANTAMNDAKSKGRNSFLFFDAKMQEGVERRYQVHLNLHHAINRNELTLVYQPQYDHCDRIIGVEALVRWNSAELGFVPPDEFIKVAEETGLIHPIGAWIINRALDDFATISQSFELDPSFKMAINISKEQFFHKTFVDQLRQVIQSKQIDPRYIQLEITESLFIEQVELASMTMFECKSMGMTIALDDFGTGYSSLSYLINLPIDKLKIDRSFVTHLDTNERSQKLVESLVNMAHTLDVEVIAEGVETKAERDELISVNCLQYQGYYYSRPVDIEDLLSLLN